MVKKTHRAGSNLRGARASVGWSASLLALGGRRLPPAAAAPCGAAVHGIAATLTPGDRSAFSADLQAKFGDLDRDSKSLLLKAYYLQDERAVSNAARRAALRT